MKETTKLIYAETGKLLDRARANYRKAIRKRNAQIWYDFDFFACNKLATFTPETVAAKKRIIALADVLENHRNDIHTFFDGEKHPYGCFFYALAVIRRGYFYAHILRASKMPF